MKEGELVLDTVDILHYTCHKISLNCSGSYIDPQKKATINLKSNNNKCFQYAIRIALNHKKIVKDLQRISKFKPFINKYNWKKIKFLSHKNDWKKFESNNKSIALNILYVPYNTKEIKHACISKHNSTRENQVILLRITHHKKWHYLAVKHCLVYFAK